MLLFPSHKESVREKLKTIIQSKTNYNYSEKYDFIRDCYLSTRSSDLNLKVLFHLIEKEYFEGYIFECIQATDFSFEVLYNNRLSSSGGRTIINKGRKIIKIELASQ